MLAWQLQFIGALNNIALILVVGLLHTCNCAELLQLTTVVDFYALPFKEW